MRVLLDEHMDHRLRRHLAAHDVYTVAYLGWEGLKNGELIATAEREGLEVFLTGDQEIQYQQKLEGRRIAIVVLSATNWPIIRNHLSLIVKAVGRATPGSFQEVECGRFTRRT